VESVYEGSVLLVFLLLVRFQENGTEGRESVRALMAEIMMETAMVTPTHGRMFPMCRP
jgi:hypothetical protein